MRSRGPGVLGDIPAASPGNWSREVGQAEEAEFGFTLKAMGATRGL